MSGKGGVEKRARMPVGQAVAEVLGTMLGLFRNRPQGFVFLVTFFGFLMLSGMITAALGAHPADLTLFVAAFLANFAAWLGWKLFPTPAVARGAIVTVSASSIRFDFPGDPSVDIPLFAVAGWRRSEWDDRVGQTALVHIDLGSGERIDVETARGDGPGLEQALSAALTHESEARSVLSRGSRTLPEWRSALRSAARSHGYRGAAPPLPEDTLHRIVADPRAPHEHRVAAALALSSSFGAPARERIRVAAAASPRKVRVALSRLADDAEDDAAVEEALSLQKR